MSFKRLIITACLALSAVASQAADLDEARIKELVYEAIREKPEIIMEAVEVLQRQERETQAESQARFLRDQRQFIEHDPNAPVLGNPDGDVTVVEFFDYNCPYCRRVMPQVQALLKSDPNIRLVYREWPILGEGSVFATQAALAARQQGKYEEFHWALMGMKGRADKSSVLKIAEEIGLDIERLALDMESDAVKEHIETSMRLTQALGFNGTPAFVIGDNLVPGFVEREKLSGLVQQTRERKY